MITSLQNLYLIVLMGYRSPKHEDEII
ncbi:uncharacterized protein METZ01_LOCUS385191 [marine metagenome]|uniref:Uncharacterized protein n=1 Tax=marine metagenome TaxID=408172 RepID=A0A382UE80_9ZZZZ